MAVTGYFIDQDWNYREILLSFELLHGHHIKDRVLTVTTDNALNNSTLLETPRAFPRALDERAEARANIRRPNSLELNVSDASACETAIVNL
ncbi:uncharacterized protein N7496_010729 [Penicillium cataractarum]|uniref:Uncharacterized protein n=1 Tax=Penicillium cataractarum TaxID=2100454 RepID=A0A9W9UXC9_9EURO|nr:uncharacterized protein N7496_010729 [Penicillium cataractarum]KAJ5358316.1 hypothetical protein N7496_010729 [Penicillium cataractarum]